MTVTVLPLSGVIPTIGRCELIDVSPIGTGVYPRLATSIFSPFASLICGAGFAACVGALRGEPRWQDPNREMLLSLLFGLAHG